MPVSDDSGGALPRAAVVVANVRSRRTGTLLGRAIALLRARGVDIRSVRRVDGGEVLRRSVGEAIDAGEPLVVVAGGDGSFTTTVGLFAHRPAALGVLPCGTGNSFARSLGIGARIEDAVEVLVAGKIAAVDLGVVNGVRFANFATVGLTSEIGRRTPAALKKLLGPLAYAAGGAVPILTSRAFEARIACDDTAPVALRTHQLVVMNGRHYGLAPVRPEATIVDGTLDLFTTEGQSRWNVVRTFLALQRGDSRRLDRARFFRGAGFAVETIPPQPLDIDGEPLGTTPARFEIERRSLRVVVPRGFAGR